MSNIVQAPINQTLLCVTVMAVLLQLAIPWLANQIPQIKGLLGMLPGVVEVTDAHAEEQIGGALVIALITVLAAVLAPMLCPMLGL